MKTRPRAPLSIRWSVVVAILLALLYIAWAYRFILESSLVAIDGKRYFNLFDDAMISMRYAWNLSHGNGLVWNPGERVEGYTNLLLTLVMSVFTALLDKSNAVLGVQILGVALVLACVYLAWKLAGFAATGFDPAARSLFAGTVAVLTLTYYPLSFWSLTGMETGLLTFLLLASLVSLELYLRDGRRASLFLVAIFLGLAYLTRPDSFIFAAPILLYAALAAWRSTDGHRVHSILLMLGIYLIFPLGQEIFRVAYYGAYLPNTYTLKLTGMPLADRIQNGLGFISLYFWTHIIFLGIAFSSLLLRPDRRKLLYAALVVLPILYQVWVGGDAWNWWRIMAPAQPIAAILFALAAFEIVRRLGSPAFTRKGLRLLAYVSAISILTTNLGFLPQMFLTQDWPPPDFYFRRVNASVILNRIARPDATLGLVGAGVAPYYTGLKAYDFLGRTDPHIAALPPDLSGAIAWSGMYSVPGHNKYDLTYSIEQLQPTYIETSKWGRQDLTDWVTAHYVSVDYGGVHMLLLKGAPEIKWDLLPPQAIGAP